MLDTNVHPWDTGAERLVAEIETGQEITNGAAPFIGESAQFLIGHTDGSIQQWDAASQTCLATYTAHDEEVTSIAYSEDGAVVSGDSAGKVLVWDIGNGRPFRTLSAADSVKHLLVSGSGQIVLAVNKQEELIAWRGDSPSGSAFSNSSQHAILKVTSLATGKRGMRTGGGFDGGAFDFEPTCANPSVAINEIAPSLCGTTRGYGIS